jgi:NAD(P)-dependent dehydrogenase (short-subunit alcohol dehydrogenase family)
MQSKAGNEMLVKIYAGEMAKTRVRANLIDPGVAGTRLRARAFPAKTRRAGHRRRV